VATLVYTNCNLKKSQNRRHELPTARALTASARAPLELATAVVGVELRHVCPRRRQELPLPAPPRWQRLGSTSPRAPRGDGGLPAPVPAHAVDEVGSLPCSGPKGEERGAVRKNSRRTSTWSPAARHSTATVGLASTLGTGALSAAGCDLSPRARRRGGESPGGGGAGRGRGSGGASDREGRQPSTVE
jgi:hypothetical protein